MTAVPGEPGRRLLLSSSARRAGNGTRPALAWGSVGLRLMTTLRILKRCGGHTQTTYLHHRDGDAAVPDLRVLQLSSISNRRSANPVPTTGFERSRVIADKSRQRMGKLRIFSAVMIAAADGIFPPAAGSAMLRTRYIRPSIGRPSPRQL